MIIVAAPSATPTALPTPVASPERRPGQFHPVCPTFPAGLVSIAVDPALPIDMRTAQQFIIALKAGLDGGYGWHVRTILNMPDASPTASGEATASPGAIPMAVKFLRQINVADVDFTNAERPAGSPKIVGGSATEFFVFAAQSRGTVAITLDLYGPSGKPEGRSVTFHVAVRPNVTFC